MAKTAEKIYRYVKKNLLHVDDRSQIEIAEANGFKHGSGCAFMGEVIIDPGHCWLIEVGDHVTLAPRVHILAHDASTKRELGYTRIAKVKIGSNVFVGAGSIILPGVVIGDNVIIGAGSVVTKDIPGNSVAAGNPCKVITSYEEFMTRKKEEMRQGLTYDKSYQIGAITDEKKQEMIEQLEDSAGYIV